MNPLHVPIKLLLRQIQFAGIREPEFLPQLRYELLRRLGVIPTTESARPVSGSERLWLAISQLQPPYAINTVVEGQKDAAPIHLARFQEALDKLVVAQPAARMRLHGALSWMRWVADGPKPRLRVLSGENWSGFDDQGAQFVYDPLDPQDGPVVEVLVVQGNPQRVVFRVPHALMDGAASVQFAQDFFTALRGQELPFITAGPPIDADLAKRFFSKSDTKKKEPECDPLTGGSQSQQRGANWVRVRIPGPVNNPVAAVGIALTKAAAETVDRSKINYLIPVNMRTIAKCEPSSANLSGIIEVGVDKALQSKDPVMSLHQEIFSTLMRRDFGNGPVLSHKYLIHIIMPVLTRLIQKKLGGENGKFHTSAVLSHLGQFDRKSFSGGGFSAQNVFSIPPAPPFSPLFMALFEHDGALELVGHTHKSWGSNGRLKGLMDRLAHHLQQK